MDIGKRIKQLRVKNNLTLEELASRCELTKGFLSQLERNLTSPSIQTLENVSEALGYSISDFFKEDIEEKIVFKEEDYFIDEKEGHKIYWIVPNAQKNKMEPIILELDELEKSQIIKPHQGEEFGYVLSGKISLVVGGKKGLPIKKGETFYINGNEEYYLKNIYKGKSRVLWVCTPPIF